MAFRQFAPGSLHRASLGPPLLRVKARKLGNRNATLLVGVSRVQPGFHSRASRTTSSATRSTMSRSSGGSAAWLNMWFISARSACCCQKARPGGNGCPLSLVILAYFRRADRHEDVALRTTAGMPNHEAILVIGGDVAGQWSDEETVHRPHFVRARRWGGGRVVGGWLWQSPDCWSLSTVRHARRLAAAPA